MLINSKLGDYTQGLTGLKITDIAKLATLFGLGEPVSDAIKQIKSLADIGAKFQSPL